MAAGEQVVELAPGASPHGFDEYVERHPGGTLFHGSAWRDLVGRHFPAHRPRPLEAWRGGRRVGVLPLFETRSPLSGRALISSPYAVYGGPLASDGAAARALLDRVRAMVGGERLRFAELRLRDLDRSSGGAAAEYAGLPGSALYAAFERDLPVDPEECLAAIPRKSRASTRQARDRHRLEFHEDDGGRLDDFHRLFVRNKQRLGSPAFSREWFADLLRLGRHRARLHVVSREGRMVAAAISFLHRDTWNPYYSGADGDADRLSASNFLYWQLMRAASAEGFRRFDFGRSRVDSGPFEFKRNMGFEPAPLPYRYVPGASGAIPSVNPGDRRFALPQRVIRSLPFALARAVGPALMRLVP